MGDVLLVIPTSQGNSMFIGWRNWIENSNNMIGHGK